jgi:hypothetical protein
MKNYVMMLFLFVSGSLIANDYTVTCLDENNTVALTVSSFIDGAILVNGRGTYIGEVKFKPSNKLLSAKIIFETRDQNNQWDLRVLKLGATSHADVFIARYNKENVFIDRNDSVERKIPFKERRLFCTTEWR